MSEEKEKRKLPVMNTHNFRSLYNKQYGDIAKIGPQSTMTPEQAFNLAVKYFEWAELNSIKTGETASFQGYVSEHRVHKVRVFTMRGFLLFAGISASAVNKWRSMPGYDQVMEFVDNVIYEQKYQLAVNSIINGSFIGKELGIDKPVEIKIDNASNSVSAVGAEEVKDAVKSIMGKI